MNIYDRIKNLRKKKGLSQTQLADMVGYKSKSMVSYVEAGKVDISESKIVQFARALDTTPEYLMGWVDDPDWRREPELGAVPYAGLLPVERRLLESFSQLSYEQQIAVLNIVENMK